jgi:hypothetical protein
MSTDHLQNEDTNKEPARIWRLIRNKVLPRMMLVRGKDGKMERNAKGKLTWRMISTYNFLTLSSSRSFFEGGESSLRQD